MESYSPRRSSGPVLRSTSPPDRRQSARAPPPSFASATSSAFRTSRSFRRPTSPTRHNPTPYSISFSLDLPGSPNRSISVSTRPDKPQKRTCLCSPTNHPGSFRCGLHKPGRANGVVSSKPQTASYAGLNMVRSAMKNSLVRIGTVEGDLVKRALAALIRPSSHQQRRRGGFRPRVSRLSVVSDC